MSRRSPILLLVHIVWATSRRRPWLARSYDERLCAILGRKAAELRCAVLASGCASDHVHVVARVASSASVGELVKRMKGASAYELNHRAPRDRRIAWQDGYWAESISPADLAPVARYVLHQRERHDDSHPFETWLASVPESATASEATRVRPREAIVPKPTTT